MSPYASIRNLNVLIVEDNDDDADLMIGELARTGLVAQTRRVQAEPDFRRELFDPPDAILSDYTVPGFGARRALQVVAELGLDIPFIVVTGSISEEVAVDCMKRGAADYLLKDRLARLGEALKQAVAAKHLRTLRRDAERARDAAMRELDHRVRNNLAVVVGLAELSVRSAQTLESFAPVFMGRVRALATVHDALGEEHWLCVDLRSLVVRIVQPYAEASDAELEIVGETVSLPPRAVQPLGLALNELACRAAKSRVWSAGGSAHISWQIGTDSKLSLLWEERHNPSPTPAPDADQLPSELTLARDLVRTEIGGAVSIAPAPHGLRVTIDLPLDNAAETPDPIRT
jgi:two-component sensor histidine kinase